jgi:II/X family phage/plasmid replication protein
VIDWITFRAPLAHQVGEGGPLYGGAVLMTDSKGELVFDRPKFMNLPNPEIGSSSTRIAISSVFVGSRPHIQVSGNPTKFFQGHNVFGTDDLHGLVLAMLYSICHLKGIKPSSYDIRDWYEGAINLSRVDINYSFDYGTQDRVLHAVAGLFRCGRLVDRSAPTMFKDETVQFGSRRSAWFIKAYAKGREMARHSSKLHSLRELHPHVFDYANRLLRVEVQLNPEFLKDEGLDQLSKWTASHPQDVHDRLVAKLMISEGNMLETPEILASLDRHSRLAYTLWFNGSNIRAHMGRTKFYESKKVLKQHGIDISIARVEEALPDYSNVEFLRRVREARSEPVPTWAFGTRLYFQPRDYVVAKPLLPAAVVLPFKHPQSRVA